uniref:CCHC-type domain-containing protein n=1 Tax=Meloidogyne hapla TaxID=6305 RepID=A0A1I8BCI8_MELHA
MSDSSGSTTTNDSPIKIRDALSSSRGGHKGGYRPKKGFQQQIGLLEVDTNKDNDENLDEEPDTKDDNDGEIFASEMAKVEMTDDVEDQKSDDDSSDSSGIDLTLSRDPKRCDFCGDLTHKSRFCSVLGQRTEGSGGGSNTTGGASVRVCFHCHEEGHIRVDCPKKRIATCFHCNKQGHVKADCPKRANAEAKKRERVTYTFRKPSSKKEEKDDSSPPIKDVYEIPSSGCEDNADIKSVKAEEKPQHHIFVPLPVPASQVKTPVVLRSKLLSSDSEPSISHKILRSESSEEEDEMESCHESDDNDKNEGTTLKENGEEKKGLDIKSRITLQPVTNNVKSEHNLVEGEDELQTISVEVDGCVEFDTDDDSSYQDCSEGEDNEKRLKRIMEEDECYGEDGALIDEGLDQNNIEEKEEIDSGATMTGEVNEEEDGDKDHQKTLT